MIEWYFLYPSLAVAPAQQKGGTMEAKVKVKALRDFFDRENNLNLVKKGTVSEVTKERAEKLVGFKVAEIIHAEEKKG